MSERSLKSQAGFSIIEILIVLAVMSAALLVGISAYNRLSRLDLRDSAGELGRLIRGTYAKAALSGKTFRIVFEMSKDEDSGELRSTYWLESSPSESLSNDLVKEEDDGIKWIDSKEREKNKYLRKPEYVRQKDEFGVNHQFPGTVHLSGVWIEGMKERVREGTVYLYFFPMGYTQKAQISLSDDVDGKNLWTLDTEPLTGKVLFGHEETPIK